MQYDAVFHLWNFFKLFTLWKVSVFCLSWVKTTNISSAKRLSLNLVNDCSAQEDHRHNAPHTWAKAVRIQKSFSIQWTPLSLQQLRIDNINKHRCLQRTCASNTYLSLHIDLRELHINRSRQHQKLPKHDSERARTVSTKQPINQSTNRPCYKSMNQ